MATLEPSAATSASPTLAGRSVLVTGGGGGLGAAICRTLAEAGARVVVADFKADAAEAAAASLRDDGMDAEALRVDVGDPDQAEAAVRSAVDRHGGLDVLVNNAGTDVTLPIEELAVGDWNRVVATNLSGPFLMTKFVVPTMKARGRGHVVNIASTAAKRAWPNASAYHATKWGLLGLSHALHAELRPHGVKVTAVVAGGMRTPFLLDRFPDIDPGILQDPANVAETVRYVLLQPEETVIPEITVIPMRETSWP